MAFGREHELHSRRMSRNMGVGLTLTAFVVVIFGLTVAKMSNGIVVEGFDHTVRPSLLEVDPQ